MKGLTALHGVFTGMLVTSFILPKMCLDINYNRTGCYASCSDQVNCTVKSVFCTLEPEKEVKSDKRIPSAASDLQVRIDEELERPVLRISWRLPSDGSYSLLEKFEIKAAATSRQEQARCYHATPSHDWKDEHERLNSNVSFFMDCIDMKKNESVAFHVSVTSLPMDPLNRKTLSQTVAYSKSLKWTPKFTVYTGNTSDIHLFVSSAYPGGKAAGYDVKVTLAGTRDVKFYKAYAKEPQGAQLPFSTLSNGTLHFHIRDQFEEDKEYFIEVEPTNPSQTPITLYFYATEKFLYKKLPPWGPEWNPCLKASQSRSPSPAETDSLGRPLTHLVLHRPIPNAVFYRLVIYREPRRRGGRRLVHNESFVADPKTKMEEERSVTVRDGLVEFVVPGLDMEDNYTFSLDALDVHENLLPRVKRITNMPLHIVGFNESMEPGLAPAMDNRVKIVAGVVITGGFVLMVTIVWFCLSKRARVESRGVGLAFVRGRLALWRPRNNSHGLKILPIYCWENEHYLEAVKCHVRLIRQYACASSVTSPRSKPDVAKWHCWSSFLRWKWGRDQKSRKLETEINGSEVIIYLSPRMAHLMSPESASGQDVPHSGDAECQSLLTMMGRLHSRGLGKRPHLVTFDCFHKDELICLDTFQWMQASSSLPGYYRHKVPPAKGAFSSVASTPERRGQAHIEMAAHQSPHMEPNREETAGLLSPLVLATQVSGVWRLQNTQELVARLGDPLEYPDRRHLPCPRVVVAEDCRTTLEVQAIEQHLQHAARLYTQTICLTEHDASISEVGNDTAAAYYCQGSSSEHPLMQHTLSVPIPATHHDGKESACGDQYHTNVCSYCGKLRYRSGEDMESDFTCHRLGESDPSTASRASKAVFSGKPSVDHISTFSADMCLCLKTSHCSPQAPALPSHHTVPEGLGAGDTSGSFKSLDVDSNMDVSNSNLGEAGNQGHKRKWAVNKNFKNLNSYKISSSSLLNDRISSGPPSPLSQPRAVLLSLMDVKGTSEQNNRPLGFSQDIIPPDQCYGETGFTEEQITRLNADSGWSEEDLVDFCNL